MIWSHWTSVSAPFYCCICAVGHEAVTLSSAETLVFLGFNITMRYISLHFTWRILEHERCGGERSCKEFKLTESTTRKDSQFNY